MLGCYAAPLELEGWRGAQDGVWNWPLPPCLRGEKYRGNCSDSGNAGGGEVLLRLLQVVVLEGKDEKARREGKGLVAKNA